jgi:hypothetical protein
MPALNMSLISFALVTLVAVLSTPADAILIRHDLDSGLYGAHADQYPSVMTFLSPADERVAETASLSATLLARDWSLTAAHGADEFQQTTLRVEVRGVVYDDVAFDIWAPHPCFDSWTGPQDLGLVHFPTPPWPELEVYPSLYDGSDELGKVIVIVGGGGFGTRALGSDGEALAAPFRNATNTIDHVSEGLIGFTFNTPGDDAISPLEGISGDDDRGGPAFMCSELSLDPMGRITCRGPRSLLGVSSYQEAPEDDARHGMYGGKERYARVSAQRAWILAVMATGHPSECTDALMRPARHEDSRAQRPLATGCQGAAAPPICALLALLYLPWLRRRSRAILSH